MPEKWKPATEHVRSHYVFNQSDKWDRERGAAFDRWLADHDKEVAAHAWDEALEAITWASENGPDPIGYVAEHNPYRSGSEGETR